MGLFEIARIVFALTAVLGMIGLFVFAAKRAGFANLQNARGKRLKLVESLALDQRRRAAIIACDGREHLIILDASSTTLVESGIPAPEPQAAANDSQEAQLHRAAANGAPSFIRFFRRNANDRVGAFRTAGIL